MRVIIPAGEEILCYASMIGNGYIIQASIAARDGKPISSTYIPPLVEGLYLSLNNMSSGEYMVNWYDPEMARWLDTATVTAQDNTFTFPIPPFRYDLAAKIIRHP